MQALVAVLLEAHIPLNMVPYLAPSIKWHFHTKSSRMPNRHHHHMACKPIKRIRYPIHRMQRFHTRVALQDLKAPPDSSLDIQELFRLSTLQLVLRLVRSRCLLDHLMLPDDNLPFHRLLYWNGVHLNHLLHLQLRLLHPNHGVHGTFHLFRLVLRFLARRVQNFSSLIILDLPKS